RSVLVIVASRATTIRIRQQRTMAWLLVQQRMAPKPIGADTTQGFSNRQRKQRCQAANVVDEMKMKQECPEVPNQSTPKRGGFFKESRKKFGSASGPKPGSSGQRVRACRLVSCFLIVVMIPVRRAQAQRTSGPSHR